MSNSELFAGKSDCCLLQESRGGSGDAYAVCTLYSDPLLVGEAVKKLSLSTASTYFGDAFTVFGTCPHY